jgi:hypothetical protein
MFPVTMNLSTVQVSSIWELMKVAMMRSVSKMSASKTTNRITLLLITAARAMTPLPFKLKIQQLMFCYDFVTSW